MAHLNEIHLVIGKTPRGDVRQVYLGEDAAKAIAAFEGAKDDLVIVGISSFPPLTKVRFPSEEKSAAKDRDTAAQTQAELEAQCKLRTAEAKRAQAAKLIEEAEVLAPTPAVETPKEKTDEPKN